MAAFDSEAALQTDVVKDGVPTYRLIESLHCKFTGNFVLVVPIGFLTDFASVPRLLWPIFPPAGEYTRAAIVHDWLYSDGSRGVSRMLADAIFRDLMADLGVPLWKRWLMWAACRAFGSKHFRGKR